MVNTLLTDSCNTLQNLVSWDLSYKYGLHNLL